MKKILSNKVILAGVAVVAIILVALLWHSHVTLKEEAMKRTEHMLEKTAMRTTSYLSEVETVTRNMEWQVMNNMCPDSLLAYTHRIVELNPNLNGCSITTEPNFFPKLGHNFSAYTVRQGQTIVTEIEGAYDYYSKDWYKKPKEAGKPVWVDPYDDFNEAGTLSSSEMIASYSMPLYDADSTFIGVISTDLSLPMLSKSITEALPCEGAYYMMTGKSGNFLVHPDKDKLVYHTIFDGVNSRLQGDIIALGNEMVKGNKGNMSVNFDGEQCLVFYQPITQTGWSIAVVCPERNF
jgi:hypothetical protein